MTLEELDNTIFCEINDEERRIDVPPIYRVLGVESDEKVNRLRFKCPRIVGDNVDLSTLNLFVNYENANSEKNIYLITDVEVVGDYIVFSWLLSRHVTEYKGNVRYIICAKKSINGDTTNEWNTRPASGVVNEGLEAIHETEEQNSDVIEEILSRLSLLDGVSQLSTPDWNENDSNSSDFIKNRTHWAEEDYVYSDVTIRNPIRVENPNLSIDFVNWNHTSTRIKLIAGDFYRLSINNDAFIVEGECKHYINQNNEFDEFDYIGNINLYDDSQESDGSVIFIGCNTVVIGQTIIRTTNDITGSSANISIGHKETIYHKLSQNYIEQPANKKTLDKLYSEGDYAPNTNNTGMPVINPNEYNYLKFGNKFLRYTEDGSVIRSVENITKDGKDFLRLYLEWDPDIIQFTDRKPDFIDIPIEGTETVEVPDWSENDADSINYIKNRTHWHENGYDYSLPSDTSNLPSIRAGEFHSAWVNKSPLMKRIGNAVSQNLFINSIIEMPLETWTVTDIRLDGTNFFYSSNSATITVFVDSNTGNQIARMQGGPEGTHVKYLCANIIGPSTNIQWNDPVYPSYTYNVTFPQTGLYVVDDDDAKHVLGLDNNGQILEDVFQITRIYCTGYTKKLDDDYLSGNVNDSIIKRHSHDNKLLLDTIITKNIPDVHSSGTAYDALMIGSKYITEPNPIILSNNGAYSITLNSGIPHILSNAVNGLTIYLSNYYRILSSEEATAENDGRPSNGNFYASSDPHSNYPEYYIDFITSSNLSGIWIYKENGAVPDIEWVDEPVFEPNKHYQISILGNIGLWVATDVEPDEEESEET